MDITKGLAILGVVLVHALINGIWFYPENALNSLPLPVLALLSPLVILATWAGFFELMSGLSNMYNVYNRVIIRKLPFGKSVQGPLVNSTGLLIVHFLFVIFFSHRRNAPYPRVYDREVHTLVTGSLEQGKLHLTDFQFFFFADVLGSIALAGYLSVFLIWVLYKIDGLENPKFAWKFFLASAIGFFVISFPIWNWGYDVTQDLLIDGSPSALVLALPLSMLAGAFQPFFPIAGFGIVGLILGLLVAVKNHKEEEPDYYQTKQPITADQFINRIAPISFLLFIVFFMIHYILPGGKLLDVLVYYRLPPTLLALNVALMLWGIKLTFILFENHDEETRAKISRRTLPIRRFGMVSLSVYVFESVLNGGLSYVYHQLIDDPATEKVESFSAPIPIIFYVLLVFVFWFAFVRLWEKAGFAYGIEYWVIRIGSRFRSTKSRKLDLRFVLYGQEERPQTATTLVPNPALQLEDESPED